MILILNLQEMRSVRHRQSQLHGASDDGRSHSASAGRLDPAEDIASVQV